VVKTGAMTRPAGAGPEDIVVAPSDGGLVAAARGRRPAGGWDIDDLVLGSALGAGAPVLERHGTDRLIRPRSEPAAYGSLDER